MKIVLILFETLILSESLRFGNSFSKIVRIIISITSATQQYIYIIEEATYSIENVEFLITDGIGSFVMYVGAGSKNISAEIKVITDIPPKIMYK